MNRYLRLLLFAFALAGLAGVSLQTSPRSAAAVAQGCTVDTLLVNSCRPWFGAAVNGYPQVSGAQNELLYFEQRTGRQAEIVHTYHAVGQFDTAMLTDVDKYVATRPDTMLYTNWALTKNFASADGSNATVNAEIDKMATSIKSLGSTKIFLTLHHEPENDLQRFAEWLHVRPGRHDGQRGRVPRDVGERPRAVRRTRSHERHLGDELHELPQVQLPDRRAVARRRPRGPGATFNGYQGGNKDVSFQNRVTPFYNLLTNQSAPGHDYTSHPWGIVEWAPHLTTQPNAYLYDRQVKEAVEAGIYPRLHFYLVFDDINSSLHDLAFRVAYGTDGQFDATEQSAFNQFFVKSWALNGDGSPPTDPLPSAPGTPTAVEDSASHPNLSWSGATDDGSVISYDILRDGTLVGVSFGTSFVDTTAPMGSHVYTVRALDDTGRVGPSSGDLVFDVADISPPTSRGA